MRAARAARTARTARTLTEFRFYNTEALLANWTEIINQANLAIRE